MTGVLGVAGLSESFVWGSLGPPGSRVLLAWWFFGIFVLFLFFFSTLTGYPRLFADVSSQFFSYGESHPTPTHPCFLRNSAPETRSRVTARDPGLLGPGSCGQLFPFAFLSPFPPYSDSFHPQIQRVVTTLFLLDLSPHANLPRSSFPGPVSCLVRLYFLVSSLVPEPLSRSELNPSVGE